VAIDRSRENAIAKTSESAKIDKLGINCGNLREPIAQFAKADCEKITSGKNNSYIVLGRDRPSSKHSGYGGAGAPQCGMIDLVAGRMSCKEGPQETFTSTDDTAEPVLVDPMFVPYRPLLQGLSSNEVAVEWASDAARVYICQMTDVDDNFNLPEGRVGTSWNKSAVAVKADAIRIIGNEGIKICTNIDGTNSSGYLTTKSGIDLIANGEASTDNAELIKHGKKTLLGKGASLQPLVKGDNLRACLDEIVEELIKLQSTMQGFITDVITANVLIGMHMHPPPIPYIPVLTDADLMNATTDINNTLATKSLASVKGHSKNFDNIKNKFLAKTGKCFINSEYNNTN